MIAIFSRKLLTSASRHFLLQLLSLALILFGSFFTTGCSHPRSESNIPYAISTIALSDAVEDVCIKEGTFTIDLFDPEVIPPTRTSKLRYPVGFLTPSVVDVPAGKYYLYCPSTSCPCMLELFMALDVTEEGNIGQLMSAPKDSPPFCAESLITTYAIPGFSSDWYLISKKDFSIRHATFDYKPIIARGTKGQSLQLKKKECGGNVVQAVMTGFEPNEIVSLSSNSEGEIITVNNITMDEKGCAKSIILPEVSGKTKGKVTVTITSKDESITATSDWNTETLRFKPLSKRLLIQEMLMKYRKSDAMATPVSTRIQPKVS